MIKQFHLYDATQEKIKQFKQKFIHILLWKHYSHELKDEQKPKCPSINKLEKKVVYLYNEILLSLKKEYDTDTCYNMDEPWNRMLSERSQTQKAIYCLIPLMWNIQNRQTHETESRLMVSKRVGDVENDIALMGKDFLLRWRKSSGIR